ncbi:MAG: hypothetical protein V3S19_01180 [Gemmatimonadales bacterium]
MPSPVFGDIVIIGGGCYGSFYTGQLELARSRDRVWYRRLIVVDRNPSCRVFQDPPEPGRHRVCAEWGTFLDGYLAGPPPESSLIVPSPLMPHLLYHWLQRRAREQWPTRAITTESAAPVGTPYETEAPDGTRYVSYADWLCPTHCIEPATCPVTRTPRTWDMAEAATRLVGRHPGDMAGPVVFECRHVAYGVGAIAIDQVLAGAAAVLDAGAGGGATDLVVATVSGCHGAFNLLHLGAVS